MALDLMAASPPDITLLVSSYHTVVAIVWARSGAINTYHLNIIWLCKPLSLSLAGLALSCSRKKLGFSPTYTFPSSEFYMYEVAGPRDEKHGDFAQD